MLRECLGTSALLAARLEERACVYDKNLIARLADFLLEKRNKNATHLALEFP